MPYAEEVKEVVFGRYQTTVVKVHTDEGVTGIGECISRLAPTATRDIVETIKPVLLGRDPRDVEVIWEILYGIMMNRGHNKGFYIEAISGIDIALWDAMAKYEGVPLYKLLGGLHNNPLECYASSIFMKEDLESSLEEAHVYWFEEPLTPDNLDGYRRLSDKLSVPIAAGETEFTRWGFRDLITKGGIGIVQPNVARTGGVTECKKIAALASAYHIPYAPHTGTSSLVCLAASLQLSAYLPNFLIYEYMRADWDEEGNPLRTQLAQESFEDFRDGYLYVPEKPGIGMELNEEVVERYRVQAHAGV